MASRALVLLLAASVIAVAVEARLLESSSTSSRKLLFANCPVGCDLDNSGCVAGSNGYTCIQCLGSLVVMGDGSCGCPEGRYASDTNTCDDCPVGSWCAGDTYSGIGQPAMTACGAHLTTIGRRSTSIKACVNMAGYSFAMVGGAPTATACPVDTWSSGLKKQAACVPCSPGYTTNGATASKVLSACLVPEGYYQIGAGQLAPCPKGEYKAGFGVAAACDKCVAGVTTLKEASKSEDDCALLLPGYYPSNIVGNVVKNATLCPQKFVCAGGAATAAFTPSPANPSPANTVAACPNGTWTQNIGASSLDQCLTPPGYKTTAGDTTPCGDGEFRADWKVPAQASACDVCGDGISSDPTDQITQYAPTADATPSSVSVRASDAACYIKAGQGMLYSAATGLYKGINCNTNNFGAGNKTFGRAAFPCRHCPSGMQTNQTLPKSAAFYATDGASRSGFTSPMACVTQAGYGYNGRVATKCSVGSWNPEGEYSSCTQCGPGLSTPNDATQQVSSNNCVVAKGYGVVDGVVQPCPVGFYNNLLGGGVAAACTPCGTGLSTSQPGGDSAADCNVCIAGYGDNHCANQCGGAAGANYGPAGQASATAACAPCALTATAFSFDVHSTNMPFAPATVARQGADNAGDCLAQFAQAKDSAWYLDAGAAMTTVAGNNTFEACAAACSNDATCQFITFSYDAADDSKCQLKYRNATGTDVVAFKAAIAGDAAAASLRKKAALKAKGLASGAYTFWKDTAAGIGTQTLVTAAGSVQACLDACDADDECAAVAMAGLTGSSKITDAPTTCNLVKGDTRVAQFKRSVTKADAGKLSLSKAFAP